MATTYTLITSQTLASSAASVTFSSIPSTYTDLVLRVSARTDNAAVSDGFYVGLNKDLKEEDIDKLIDLLESSIGN